MTHGFELAPTRSQVKGSTPPASAEARKVLVVARKRPIFSHEEGRGDFDVVSASDKSVAVHLCMMNPDLKGMFMRNNEFGVGLAFDEESTNDEVRYLSISVECYPTC